MAVALKGERVWDLIFPEAIGIGGLIVGHLVIRAVDAAYGLDKSFRRVSDYGHLAVLLGSGYCAATGRAADLSKAIFYADSGLVASSFGDLLYERTVGKKVKQITLRKKAEEIAKKRAEELAKLGGQGGGQLTEAQTQLLLQAAKIAAEQGGRQAALAGSVLEF